MWQYTVCENAWLYIFLILVSFNMQCTRFVGSETSVKFQKSSKDKMDGGEVSQTPNDSEFATENNPEVMTKLKRHLDMTENLLGSMLGSSSVMFTSRDKVDNAVESVHAAASSVQMKASPFKPHHSHNKSHEMYESALKLLRSSDRNKHDAYKMLDEASHLGHNKSKVKIAWEILLGNLNRKLEDAKKTFLDMADSGEPDAHMALGFLYASGILERSNQARALVHYMLGALGGSVWAQIALGYRYKSGITVASNCEKSLQFYELAAKEVASHISSSAGTVVNRVRLIDLEDNGGSSSYWLDADLIQYYEYMAAKGDLNAQVSLGQLYYHGMRGCVKDIRKAKYYFTLASTKGSPTALAYLGQIYMEDNEITKPNVSAAFHYFHLAAEKNHPIGISGLGLIYLKGRGVEVDLEKARRYFAKAADLGWVEGQLQLGVMYMNGVGVTKDYRSAFKYFHLAAQHGNVLAYYHLGQMHSAGYGVLRSCTAAVELYKSVAERGNWNEYLTLGSNKYRSGKYFNAFVIYALLAELGYEVAQSNAAFLLERGMSGMKNMTKNQIYARAFNYWRRAAQQGHPLAYIKLGDYFYYGQGVPVDYEAAVNQYRLASNQYGNAQALFNIGYMHERGLGMPKDLAMAKRFYDLAATVSPDAYVPVCIALIKLVSLMIFDYFISFASYSFVSSIAKICSSSWDIYALAVLFIALNVLLYRRM